jgi:hypothetical protein
MALQSCRYLDSETDFKVGRVLSFPGLVAEYNVNEYYGRRGVQFVF